VGGSRASKGSTCPFPHHEHSAFGLARELPENLLELAGIFGDLLVGFADSVVSRMSLDISRAMRFISWVSLTISRVAHHRLGTIHHRLGTIHHIVGALDRVEGFPALGDMLIDGVRLSRLSSACGPCRRTSVRAWSISCVRTPRDRSLPLSVISCSVWPVSISTRRGSWLTTPSSVGMFL
jgi:hypothetical protein